MVNWQGPQSLWQYVHYTRPKSNIETENHRKIHRNIFLLSFGGWGNSRELPEPENGNKKDHHPKHRVRGAMSVLFVICCPGSYCHIQIFISLLRAEAPESLLKMAILLKKGTGVGQCPYSTKMNGLVIAEDSHTKLDHMWHDIMIYSFFLCALTIARFHRLIAFKT